MHFTESDYSDLLSLFDYVGKKFSEWEEIAANWGLSINEPFNFPVGSLYAKDCDQAGAEYWFYDGVLSYGVYVWVLLGAVCSVITIKKGKHTDDSGNFSLEKKPVELPKELSACSRLFAPILNLTRKDWDTEADLVKEASRLIEAVASFSEAKEQEYFFSLKDDVFPKHIVDKCTIAFEVWQGKLDGIYLVMTDEAQKKAQKIWKAESRRQSKAHKLSRLFHARGQILPPK